jgi:hypothetical protein
MMEDWHGAEGVAMTVEQEKCSVFSREIVRSSFRREEWML